VGKVKYLVAILILTGCGSVDCPSFPDEGLDWMPYVQGDNISFSDGTDTSQLNVYETHRTSYSYGKLLSHRASCVVEAHAKLSSNSSLPQFNMYGNSYSADLPRSYTINIIDVNFNFTIYNYGVMVYNNNGLTCENITKFDNGFKEYVDVVKVAYDTLLYSETPIYQVFLAKKVGVIQFKDRFDHKTWSLIGK